MKTQIKISVVMAAILGTSYAFAKASEIATRKATPIEFNKMIGENILAKDGLHKSVNDKMDTELDSELEEKSKVFKFVDVELSMGKDRPVVDRRYNSVTGAVMVDVSGVGVSKTPEEQK